MTEPAPETLLADALDSLDVSVCLADARLDDAPLVWVNAAFERLTGYTSAEVIGRNCRFLQAGLPAQDAVAELRLALAARRRTSTVLLNRRRDGSVFANHVIISPLHDDSGQVTHLLALQRDVTASPTNPVAAASGSADADQLARVLHAPPAPRRLPDAPGLDAAVCFEAAGTPDGPSDRTALSGDFYDLFETIATAGPERTWNAVMGDVAGRGAGAGAYTEMIRNLLKGLALRPGTPAGVLELLNAALLDELGDRFVTVALAQLQLRRDAVDVTVGLAGHAQPVAVIDGEARLVGQPGDLLGAFPAAEVTDSRLQLAPGDALLLYTDGVTEAGPAHDQFGEDRLLETVQASVDAARPAPVDASHLACDVMQAVHQHTPVTEDDSAVLALRIDPTG